MASSWCRADNVEPEGGCEGGGDGRWMQAGEESSRATLKKYLKFLNELKII